MNGMSKHGKRVGLGGTAVLLLLLALAGVAAARETISQVVHLPVIFSPATPLERYETEFEDDIEPWRAVRWQKDAIFDIDHDDDCSAGRCGLLEIDVDKSDSYAIASPLLLGPERPYVIETHARLSGREEKHQLGIVFSADWDGGFCPGGNDQECFNRYYEFRVRYRDVNGDQFLEYRLRRIESHDGNGVEQGEDLVDWTRADGLDPSDWHKWSVRYGSRGDITFKVNNNELPGSARDTRYDDPGYFGLLGRAGENDGTQARFDDFRIYKD